MVDEPINGNADSDGDRQVDESRREALVQMAKFARLATPAVVALLTADATTVWAASLEATKASQAAEAEEP